MSTSFLHSPAWEKLLQLEGLAPIRHDHQLYTTHRLPFGSYFAGSRIELRAGQTLPVWPTQPIFVRLEPLDTSSLELLQHHHTLTPTTATQPRQTSLVDISRTPEDIINNFEAKHRYNTRLAERKGVEVSCFSGNSLEQLPRFLQLLEATATRQRFRTHQSTHYQKMCEVLAPAGIFHLLIASKDGVDLAAMIMLTYETTATYLHGASSDRQKNLMAPHLMHWRAIEHSKQLGCTSYDLWGTHAVRQENQWEPIAGHPSAGVTRFKLGFGGTIVEYPGSFDLILQPFWYTAYTVLRRLRSGKRAFS